jgi:hypothetical protein
MNDEDFSHTVDWQDGYDEGYQIAEGEYQTVIQDLEQEIVMLQDRVQKLMQSLCKTNQ